MSTCREAFNVGMTVKMFHEQLSQRKFFDTRTLVKMVRPCERRFQGPRCRLGASVEAEEAGRHGEKVFRRAERLLGIYGVFVLLPKGGKKNAALLDRRLTRADLMSPETARANARKIELPAMRRIYVDPDLAAAFSVVHAPNLLELEGDFSEEFLQRHAPTLLVLQCHRFPPPFTVASYPRHLDVLELTVPVPERTARLLLDFWPRRFLGCRDKDLPPCLVTHLEGYSCIDACNPWGGFDESLYPFDDIQWFTRTDVDSDEHVPPDPPPAYVDRVLSHVKREWRRTAPGHRYDIMELKCTQKLAALTQQLRVLILPCLPICIAIREIAASSARPEELHIFGCSSVGDDEEGRFEFECLDIRGDIYEKERLSHSMDRCKSLNGDAVVSVMKALKVVHVDTRICSTAERLLSNHLFVSAEDECHYCPESDCMHADFRRKSGSFIKGAYGERLRAVDARREGFAALVMDEFNFRRNKLEWHREEVALYAYRTTAQAVNVACDHYGFVLGRRRDYPCRWWVKNCECRFNWRWNTLIPGERNKGSSMYR
eukprot:Polyplicarium_translucidae@DN2727_c0_g1_i4.p1